MLSCFHLFPWSQKNPKNTVWPRSCRGRWKNSNRRQAWVIVPFVTDLAGCVIISDSTMNSKNPENCIHPNSYDIVAISRSKPTFWWYFSTALQGFPNSMQLDVPFNGTKVHARVLRNPFGAWELLEWFGWWLCCHFLQKGRKKVSLSPSANRYWTLLEIGNVQFIILVTDEATSQGGTCHPEKPIWMET